MLTHAIFYLDLLDIACPALKRHIQTYITPTHSTGVEEGRRIFGTEDVLGIYFNVSFIINARPLFLMESAAETIGGELALGHDPGSEVGLKAKRIKSHAVAAQDGEKGSPESNGAHSIPQQDWPNFARRWLFPEPTDLASTCSISFPRPKTIESEEYVDQGLNEEQKVSAACS